MNLSNGLVGTASTAGGACTASITPFRGPLRGTWLQLVVVALLVAASSRSTMAQGGRSSDNILYPQPPIALYVGLEGGYAQWENEAAFTVGDNGLNCASFTSGEGQGPDGGLRALIYLNRWLMISPRVRYEARSGVFMSPLAGEPARDRRDSVVTLEQEAQVDATLAAVTVELRVGVELFNTGIYLSAGPSAAFLLDGFYDYTERFTAPPEFIHANNQSNESKLVTGRSFERYEKYSFDLRGGLGYLLRFGDWAINPEIFYSYPLTSAFAEPELLKQTGILGSLGILYNFGD